MCELGYIRSSVSLPACRLLVLFVSRRRRSSFRAARSPHRKRFSHCSAWQSSQPWTLTGRARYSASACGFRRGRSPRMRRGPARKSRDLTMPELFRASSNQLPSVGICPTNAPQLSAFNLRRRHRRAAHWFRDRPSTVGAVPCPMPVMPIHRLSNMRRNKICSNKCLYGTRRCDMVPGSMAQEPRPRTAIPIGSAMMGIASLHPT